MSDQKILSSQEGKFVTVNGHQLHYVEFGRGPLLILIHGWNNDWSGFVPIIEKLSRFRVIALDLPGYGKSDEIPGNYTVSKMSETLADFIDAVGRPEILCALSMGGVVASDFAVKNPDKLNCLVLIGPPLIQYDHILSKTYRNLVYGINTNFITRKIVKKIMAGYWYGHIVAKYINMYQYDKKVIDKYGLAGRKKIGSRVLFGMGVAMYNYHIELALRKLTIPTKIILGRYDKIIDHDEAKKIDGEKKNITLDWVDNSGHVVCLEKPQETAASMIDFAKKLHILG